MAGRDTDARAAVQIPHRPAQRRGGLQPGVEPRGDAVGRQYPGCLPGEEVSLDTAVVGDGRRLGQVRRVEVVRQSLGSAADGIDVHPVCPRADDSTQSSCAKLQMPVKTVGHRLFVALYLLQLSEQLRVLSGPLQPAGRILLIVHRDALPFCRFSAPGGAKDCRHNYITPPIK